MCSFGVRVGLEVVKLTAQDGCKQPIRVRRVCGCHSGGNDRLPGCPWRCSVSYRRAHSKTTHAERQVKQWRGHVSAGEL